MSHMQRDAVDQLLREAPLDLGGRAGRAAEDPRAALLTSIPLAGDVVTVETTLGGIPVVSIDVPGTDPDDVILYFHGGAYALGTAATSVGLASELGRKASTKVVSVDYRLAPEHPFPAAVDDAIAAYRGLLGGGLAASRIAVAGESAGAGLAATLLVALRAEGLPQPAGAALLSPWADLTLSGASLTSKAAVDPALTVDGLRRRAAD
jgi:monoterpene epsilon-lactone hydrolase